MVVETKSPYEVWARQYFKLWPDSEFNSGRGYEPPGPTHEKFLFDEFYRTYLVSGGERGAKSWTTAAKAALLTIEFVQRYGEQAQGKVAWVVANTYDLTNVEMSEVLHPFIASVIPGTRIYKNNQHWEIAVPITSEGQPFIIRTKSALDPESLRAEAPVWSLVCEVALLSEEAYLRLYGRMGQMRSQFPEFGQMICNGTFEGAESWYPAIWLEHQNDDTARLARTTSISLPSHENRFAWPGGENNPSLIDNKRILPEALFLERHMAIPAPPSGRVHERFDKNIHVKEVTYDPFLPVYIGMDPGYSGASSTYAVEVLQKKPIVLPTGAVWHQWQVVDEIFERQHTVEEICGMAMQRFWWKNPNKVGVIDIAGTYHAGAREPNSEVWQKLTGLHLMSQRVNIQPGIDRFNTMLENDPVSREPRLVMHPNIKGLKSELGGGPNPFDSKLHVYSWQHDRTGVRVGKVPRDEYCDAIKAVTYLLVNQVGYAEANQGQKRRHVRNIRRGRELARY